MSDIVERLVFLPLVHSLPVGVADVTSDAATEITRLRAQVAALEVDAGRYKYLRDVAWGDGSLIFYAEWYGPEDWDAHIDAALAVRKGAA